MIKLIKNELKKIFKKKTIYCLLFVILAIIIINTIVGTDIYNGVMVDNNEEFRNSKETELTEKLKTLNLENNVEEYIKTKTELDSIKMLKKYPCGSWQERVMVKYSSEMKYILNDINIYTYANKSKEKLEEANNKYNEFLKLLERNNWQEFVILEIQNKESKIRKLEQDIKDLKQGEITENIENYILQLMHEIELLNIRLEENISYEISDRNTLLKQYQKSREELSQYYGNIQDYNQKLQYNKVLAQTKELEYKIYHNIPTLKADNARDMLVNSMNYYEILIVMVIIIISASIISEEFNKGTIKLLLIKPYKRWKILLSKLITVILITIIIIMSILLIQTIVGGVVYGFEDYTVPVIKYDFNVNSVIEINAFADYFILIGAKLPMYLLLLTITFGIATLSSNTSISIILGVLLYLSENIIYVTNNMKFSKYLLTTNWDFTRYLFGNLAETNFLTFDFSILICAISFIIAISITFIYFSNKDIKNI